MTRPIAALRSPTLMNILANVALWLTSEVPARSVLGLLIPQQQTFKSEPAARMALGSGASVMRFPPLHPPEPQRTR